MHRPARGIRHAYSSITMSEPRNLRCYQYVDRPYEKVRELFHSRPLELLQRATTSAAARADSLGASLKVKVGGIELGVDVRAYVQRVRDEPGIAGLSPITCVDLGWEAARASAFFPSMQAVLSASPLSATETQLEVEGAYQPPFGQLGSAIDAVFMHRVAEAAVHRFLNDVVEQIRREVTQGG
jgi:hypothetical protein